MDRLLLFFTVIAVTFHLSGVSDDEYEKFTFTGSGTTLINARLWFSPASNPEFLVIDVNPCLSALPADSSNEEKFETLLREKIIEKGNMYVEFAGRIDSICKYGQKYPSSTYLTKAEDLENVIRYLKTREDTKNKKIILIGQSEGGTTSMKVASSNTNIHAMVLISTPGLSGYETLKYQLKYRDTVFMGTFGTHPEVFSTLNNISSVKEKKYEPNFEGYAKFKRDMFEPLEEIVYENENYDTIAAHVIQFLEEKWAKEDEKTKALHSNFINYCKAHQYSSFIRPENVAKLKAQPELYLSRIKCPVLAVYGTKDRNVEYSSSLEKMEEMLNKGGNYNFSAITLENYDHLLNPPGGESSVARDNCINNIVAWIFNQ